MPNQLRLKSMKTPYFPWPSKPPKNIIVRMPNWIGDAVMATPLLTDLRRQWKEAKITVICQTPIDSVLQHHPDINSIYAFRRPKSWLNKFHHFEVIDFLQKGQYDLGLLLTNSFSSAWWFLKGKVQHRLGFADGFRSLLLNKAIPFPKNKEFQHQVITYKTLLGPLAIPVSSTPPQLYVSTQELQEAHHFLHRCGIDLQKNILVGINPGAAYGSAKCWPPERFNKLTKKLLENPNVFVIYFGDSNGVSVVNQICQDLPNRAINLAGRTSIRELIALLKCCSIFLTNDSGPMHIAAALGVRLLALFGSTNEIKTGPYPQGVVIHKHVECSPCYKRVCPIDFRCMTKIKVEEVYEQLERLLKENSC
ncbi:hypothetical protein DB41_CO00250 [Neochlamydia sp. TUME1]|nr:hypothetical protein DB41_CO00250 [Neochlamydia sp. TUME1]